MFRPTSFLVGHFSELTLETAVMMKIVAITAPTATQVIMINNNVGHFSLVKGSSIETSVCKESQRRLVSVWCCKPNHTSTMFWITCTYLRFSPPYIQHTRHNKHVEIAFYFLVSRFFIDTAVEAGVMQGQIADCDGVIPQGAFYLNPVHVSLSWGNFVIGGAVIVKHLVFFLKIMIQIHPNMTINAARTSCCRTLQGNLLTGSSVQCNVLCHKKDKLFDYRV